MRSGPSSWISRYYRSDHARLRPIPNRSFHQYRGASLQRLFDIRIPEHDGRQCNSNSLSDDDWACRYIFILAVDNNNWYHLLQEGGTIYVQTELAGAKSTIATIPYSPSTQKYWAIEHNVTTNQLLFEVSPNNSTWTTVATVNVTVPVSALHVGLDAGTWEVESAPGTAVFGPLFWQPPGGSPESGVLADKHLGVTGWDRKDLLIPSNWQPRAACRPIPGAQPGCHRA